MSSCRVVPVDTGTDFFVLKRYLQAAPRCALMVGAHWYRQRLLVLQLTRWENSDGDRMTGSFRSLFLYDLCEEIRLEELRKDLRSPGPGREPQFRHPVPEYVRFERPPVVELLEPVVLEAGERLRC